MTLFFFAFVNLNSTIFINNLENTISLNPIAVYHIDVIVLEGYLKRK